MYVASMRAPSRRGALRCVSYSLVVLGLEQAARDSRLVRHDDHDDAGSLSRWIAAAAPGNQTT